jgi:hypothetical protein
MVGMAKEHDQAAERVAKKLGGIYDPTGSPDVTGPSGHAEVKSQAGEIPQALQQLAGCRGPAYIVLPASEMPDAKKRLKDLKTGLMDYTGRVVKPSSRKR